VLGREGERVRIERRWKESGGDGKERKDESEEGME
jgi:hypothetical protein